MALLQIAASPSELRPHHAATLREARHVMSSWAMSDYLSKQDDAW